MNYKIQLISAAELVLQFWCSTSELETSINKLKDKYKDNDAGGYIIVVWEVIKSSCVFKEVIQTAR